MRRRRVIQKSEALRCCGRASAGVVALYRRCLSKSRYLFIIVDGLLSLIQSLSLFLALDLNSFK